ncbi:AAA family ATPase, partial [Planomonospora algeriensis]
APTEAIALIDMEEVMPCGTAGTPDRTVVMMCGLAGSGKTTYALALEESGYTRLSIDEEIWRRFGRDGAEFAPDEYERHKGAAEEVRNTVRGANAVTVSEELLDRYLAGFEEPAGEGERAILQR